MGRKLPERRQAWIVDPRMQRRFVLSASWPLVVILGVMIVVQLVLDAQVAEQLRRHELVLKGFGLRSLSLALFAVFALVYVALMSLRLSHRVAGASYRLRETLKSFRRGDRLARAELRDGDLLKGLEAETNEFLDWAQKTLRASAVRGGPAQRTEQTVAAGKPASPAGAGP